VIDTDVSGRSRLVEVANRLSRISREQRYDVYTRFDWPASLPTDRYWMSPELTTCHGSAVWDGLGERERITLSQFEAVNFFSLNVHLIRELIGEVAGRIHTTRYPGLSEFFHDFLHEENQHMWFFARFCQLYGGQVYPSRAQVGPPVTDHDVLRDLTVFGRILVAEELCDVFNARMADDDRLPAIAREINAVHHDDESRHIAFGRQIMRALHEEAVRTADADERRKAGVYLAHYISVCLKAFYNPRVYEAAGLAEPRRVRPRLLADPARKAAHKAVMGRTVSFLTRIGVLTEGMVEW
jgi:hypothetical protein